MIALTVNGKAYSLDIEWETPLLWVIRDELGMTGTKFRACTVHVEGEAVRSCSIQVEAYLALSGGKNGAVSASPVLQKPRPQSPTPCSRLPVRAFGPCRSRM